MRRCAPSILRGTCRKGAARRRHASQCMEGAECAYFAIASSMFQMKLVHRVANSEHASRSPTRDLRCRQPVAKCFAPDPEPLRIPTVLALPKGIEMLPGLQDLSDNTLANAPVLPSSPTVGSRGPHLPQAEAMCRAVLPQRAVAASSGLRVGPNNWTFLGSLCRYYDSPGPGSRRTARWTMPSTP